MTINSPVGGGTKRCSTSSTSRCRVPCGWQGAEEIRHVLIREGLADGYVIDPLFFGGKDEK